MPTPKAGSREDQDELAIYINEFPTINKETREKLQTITKIADTIDKTDEEEQKVRAELINYIINSEKADGPLADKLVTLEEHYKLLAELEQDLIDIRKRGNIIAHEKKAKIPDTETLSQDKIEALKAN